MSQQHNLDIQLDLSRVHLYEGIVDHHSEGRKRLTKKPYMLFLCLVEQALVKPGRFLTNVELIHALYPLDDKTIDEKHALEGNIYELRKALGDHDYVENFSGIGYRLNIVPGSGTFSIEEVQQLIKDLNKR